MKEATVGIGSEAGSAGGNPLMSDEVSENRLFTSDHPRSRKKSGSIPCNTN